MSGLDALREEMLKRGLTKTQVESKAVAVVLDILANAPDKTVFQQQYEFEQAEKKMAEREAKVWRREAELERKVRDTESWVSEQHAKTDREISEKYEELSRFKRELLSCETAEARDRLRMAIIYKGAVNVNTVYDNTAYIKGLAEILAKKMEEDPAQAEDVKDAEDVKIDLTKLEAPGTPKKTGVWKRPVRRY